MSERPGPRISVNKLGEYMVASPQGLACSSTP